MDPWIFDIVIIIINNKNMNNLLDNYDGLVVTVNYFSLFILLDSPLDRFNYYLFLKR